MNWLRLAGVVLVVERDRSRSDLLACDIWYDSFEVTNQASSFAIAGLPSGVNVFSGAWSSIWRRPAV